MCEMYREAPENLRAASNFGERASLLTYSEIDERLGWPARRFVCASCTPVNSLSSDFQRS